MVFRGQTLGKYRIIEPLGSGGFATVYLAEDTWIDKRVALKVPHRQNLDFGELLKEPRLLASLSHPNIVMVITAEKQDNVFFIVMEYVPGDTLETIIMERGPMELMRALDYTAQICNAVEHAHKHNVLHRDLRPANVFVTDKGQVEGWRLRHGARDRDCRARHHGHRQPAVHGAGTVRRPRGARVGSVFGGRDGLSDAHGLTAIRNTSARRPAAAQTR